MAHNLKSFSNSTMPKDSLILNEPFNL